MDIKGRLAQSKQIVKYNANKIKFQKLVSGSRVLLVFGIILIVAGIPGFGTSLSRGIDPTTIFSIAIGLFLIYMWRNNRKKLTKSYTQLVSSGLRDVKQIAARNKIDSGKAEKHLQQMIEYGYFENAYLDTDKQCIVFHDENKPTVSTSTSTSTSTYSKTIVCKGCGATNIVQTGQKYLCEYCGSVLFSSYRQR